MGAYGNTAEATQSAAQLVQVLNPNGLEKFEAGQQYQIDFRSAGLTLFDPVLLINTGGTIARRRPGLLADQPLPDRGLHQLVLELRQRGESLGRGQSGAGGGLPELPVSAVGSATASPGTSRWRTAQYVVRLHFAEPELRQRQPAPLRSAAARARPWRRTGHLRRAPAAPYKALVARVRGQRGGRAGHRPGPDQSAPSNGAIISGIEICAPMLPGVAAPTVDLEVSIDNGATLDPDRGGAVHWTATEAAPYLWTAGPQTVGQQRADPRHRHARARRRCRTSPTRPS